MSRFLYRRRMLTQNSHHLARGHHPRDPSQNMRFSLFSLAGFSFDVACRRRVIGFLVPGISSEVHVVVQVQKGNAGALHK